MDRLFLWDDGPGGNVGHVVDHGLNVVLSDRRHSRSAP